MPCMRRRPAVRGATILDGAFTALIALSVTAVMTCALSGWSPASQYRSADPPAPKTNPVTQAERAKPPSTLFEDERAGVLAVTNSAQYADLSICQIWAREPDADRDHASISTMSRIAWAAGQTRERRRLATHPAKVKAEILATVPSQVWSCYADIVIMPMLVSVARFRA
ncbi:hypothetical protein [Cryobacterium sp. CG_9.6]|uniref:hypothetical protein n=1 Tax=Cryobacterium sp. CG_9.6 TaxID=2760710 RepID=UPI002476A168|nr:hypothetical protein [Cryobacterium sp. CG_9.6]